MSNKHDSATGHDATSDTAGSDAAWHPFNVWRNQVRPSPSAVTTPLASGDGSKRPDWDPFSVWKNQVKRS